MKPAAPTVSESAIPHELCALRQWLIWRYELRDGDWTKVPLDAADGDSASTTNPATWADFNTAMTAYRTKRGGADGIGFAFAVRNTEGVIVADGPYTGIDLDDCRQADGTILPWAADIIRRLASYSEISPGGAGVKIIVRAVKPVGRCRKGDIEIYNQGRFFTITGNRLPDCPSDVADRQAELAALHAETFPAIAVVRPAPSSPANMDDFALLEKARNARNGAKFARVWNGDITDYGGDESAADFGLASMLAFWTGNDPGRIERLMRMSGLARPKWDKHKTYFKITIGNLLAGRTEFYGQKTKSNGQSVADKPTIVISTAEKKVNDFALAALASDPEIYQRAGELVHVVCEPWELRGVPEPITGWRMSAVQAPSLRERLADCIDWKSVKPDRNGEAKERPAHPPEWCVAAILARGQWANIRPLENVIESPVLRYDGIVLDRPGYDEVSGLLLVKESPQLQIPPQPTQEQAREAADLLLDAVCDFPFASDDDKATWVASVLTPLARFAFAGPSPLFLIDANVRGAGKTLLADVAGIIVSGRSMPAMLYAHDNDEMRKRITATVIAGQRTVLLDNITGMLGNAALDAALTGTVWEDRLLGENRNVIYPLITTWYATGNNVTIFGDTIRRACRIRIESQNENPEQRDGFKRPNLLPYVKAERNALLSAALTILRAFWCAGLPDLGLVPWGRYEGWSRLVRQAVVFAGLNDPAAGRLKLAEETDTDADVLRRLLDGFIAYAGGSGNAVSLDKMYSDLAEGRSMPELVSILSDLPIGKGDGFRTNSGMILSKRSLGNRLKHFRKRVCDGKYFDKEGYSVMAKWKVCLVP